jgi:hypothetical protein
LTTSPDTSIIREVAPIERNLELYLHKKAPALPVKWQQVLVKYLPWITLIFLILSLPPLLILFGIGAVFMPFSFVGGVGSGALYTLSLVALAATVVLEAMAVPGLFNRKMSGWKLLYYSALLNGVFSILSVNIMGLLLGTALSLYLLYQIKHHYH